MAASDHKVGVAVGPAERTPVVGALRVECPGDAERHGRAQGRGTTPWVVPDAVEEFMSRRSSAGPPRGPCRPCRKSGCAPDLSCSSADTVPL